MIDVTFYGIRDFGTAPRASHFHSDYEMIYISAGWMEMQVSGRIYHVEAPSVIFLSHLETHQIISSSPDYERYVLTVSPDELDGIPPLLLSILRNRPIGFSHHLSLSGNDSVIGDLFGRLLRSASAADDFSALHKNSLFRLLLVELYRVSPLSFPSSVQPCPQAIIQAQQYIDGHFTEELSVDDIAQSFFMSACYFRHQFRAMVGIGPKQYITLNRLVYARRLLTLTALSVDEIAEKSGFGDTNNFIRRFRTQYGITPGKFRRFGE